ncbi:MAG: 4Fe-4S ferredoxin, partial [Myxococcales bacterium]
MSHRHPETDHPTKAAKFIENQERAAWHDQSLWLVRAKRDKAASAIPEWEKLRALASQIKLHMLSRMDEYLLEFESKASANGIQIHFATDAEEHNRIVHGILAAHGITK